MMNETIPVKTELTVLLGDPPKEPLGLKFYDGVGCSLYRAPVFEDDKPTKVGHDLSAGETVLLPDLLGVGYIPLVVGPDLTNATASNGSVADLRRDNKGWMCTCLHIHK